MFGLGSSELWVLLIIVLVVFGGSKLRHLGRDLGGAIHEFKDSVKGDEAKKNGPDESSEPADEEK